MILSVVFVSVAMSQAAPQLQVLGEPETVGVGEMVHLQLSATSADAMPSEPLPGATQGFVVRGQNSSPSTTLISINGSRMDRYTLTTTWALEAQRTGTFHVGPASVVVGGTRFASQPVTITVVAAGQAPRRRPSGGQPPWPTLQNPFTMSPFDIWRGLLPPGFDDERRSAEPTTDPKLALDVPRGSYCFFHSTVDKANAVVGEQVVFSAYEYFDIGADRVEIDGDSLHDASVADFIKYPLQRDDQEPPLAGYASIGGRTWAVRLIRRWALFPLHVGDLTIGPMHARMASPASVAGAERSAETLRVHVTEPPLAGRPPGYVLGDAGRFSFSAQVSPREVDQGAAVGVHVELSGTGNLPSALGTPAREGVEWLAPEVHDELGPTNHDVFGGKRTFDFVVRLRRAGAVDLGELVLPFWDSDSRKYDIARARLGVVQVRASPAQAGSSQEEAHSVLPALPAPRDALEGWAAVHTHADDSPIFWIAGIGGCPLAFGVGVAGRAVGRRALARLRGRRLSPGRELKARMAAAVAACRDGDARSADSAIARALEAATVAHAGVSLRGAVDSELVDRLERAGVASDAAARVAELLRECESARFAPEAVDIVAARDRWVRAQGAIRRLERGG
jgi:oxygen tolerance protein BatD